MDLNYTGWKRWKPTNDEWIDFYTDNKVPFEMKDGEYLILEGEDTVVSYYCFEDGKFRHCSGGSIKTGVEASVEEEFTTGKGKKKYSKSKQPVITPRNDYQVCAFDLVQDTNKTVKLLTGNFGSGKTMLVVAAALQMLNNGQVDKIVWLRNNVVAAGTEQIGYLPGTELEKIRPWLSPFIDHLKDEKTVQRLIEHNQLEVSALGYIRGRNIERAAIICSEAQNLTEELVKLIIGRAGEGTYIFFDGDFKHQVDKDIFKKSPGIKRMIEVLAGNKLFGYVDLPISERSATARLADEFDKTEEQA